MRQFGREHNALAIYGDDMPSYAVRIYHCFGFAPLGRLGDLYIFGFHPPPWLEATAGRHSDSRSSPKPKPRK